MLKLSIEINGYTVLYICLPSYLHMKCLQVHETSLRNVTGERTEGQIYCACFIDADVIQSAQNIYQVLPVRLKNFRLYFILIFTEYITKN